MGKINSRTKGAAFERDIAKRLNIFFEENGIDFKAKRNLEQYQEKDLGDLDIPNHIIECKRYASGNWYKDEWWLQVCDSCGEDNIPVLIWKYNHQPIRVCVPLWSILHKDLVASLSEVIVKPSIGWSAGNSYYVKKKEGLPKDNSVTVVLTFEHWLQYELAYNL
jgi:hypothetical protein